MLDSRPVLKSLLPGVQDPKNRGQEDPEAGKGVPELGDEVGDLQKSETHDLQLWASWFCVHGTA